MLPLGPTLQTGSLSLFPDAIGQKESQNQTQELNPASLVENMGQVILQR